MLFVCVFTCFKIYTNLPCGKSMYIYRIVVTVIVVTSSEELYKLV